MSATQHRRVPGLAAALAVAACVIVLAGCGSPASPAVPSVRASAAHSGQPGPVSLSEALRLAGQCMRQHGISGLSDPTVGSDGQVDLNKPQLLAAPKSVQDQATTACRAAFARAQAATGHPAANGPPSLSQVRAFSRCMRAHGITNFPDPAPGTGEVTLPPGMAKDSPVLAAAQRACQHLVNGGGS